MSEFMQLTLDEARERVEELEPVVKQLLEACEAVLLFYNAPEWDRRHTEQWQKLTRSSEATTVNMCNAVRAAVNAAKEAGL